MVARLLTLIVFAASAAACGATDDSRKREDSASSIDATNVSSTACAVTVPNGGTPPGESPHSSHHGNGQLWATLYYPTLAVSQRNRDDDGSATEKFGWWRAVPGALTIAGERVDDPSLRVKARIPSGYGDTGFQVASITFPTEGCWRVVGRVGASSLHFVVAVGE